MPHAVTSPPPSQEPDSVQQPPQVLGTQPEGVPGPLLQLEIASQRPATTTAIAASARTRPL